MIVYLDASALVKRYVAEAESAEFEALNGEARAVRLHAAKMLELALLAEAFIMNSYFLPARSAERPGLGYLF